METTGLKIVRDGKKVWPTCPECQCRLEVNFVFENTNQEHALITHFYGGPDKDAKGCVCTQVDKLWISGTSKLKHIGV